MSERNYKDKIRNLEMEIVTIIMGYEKELLKCNREEISEFSKGCMERYFDLMKQLKSGEENAN